MPTTRRASYAHYSTDFRIAVHAGLVPASDHAVIPKSTRSDMRTKPLPAYTGSDYKDILATIDIAKTIAEHRSLKAAMHGLCRIMHLAASLRLPFHKLATVTAPELRAKIVGVVQRVRSAIPLAIILKRIKLSRVRFESWARSGAPCQSSPLGRCRARHPNQLTTAELAAIKRAFASFDPATVSLHAYAERLVATTVVACSPDTVVRYVKRLGLCAPLAPHKRRRKRGSIAAAHPDLVWHADVTCVHALDHAKVAVHLVMDGNSRKIIAYRVATTASKASLIEALTEAHRNVPASRRNNDALPDTVVLLTDGGSENDNDAVKACTRALSLRHLIAQRDVVFSNSLIEAANKVLKYRYIFSRPIMNADQLHAAVAAAIEAYNNRPHYALSGLTPNEVYAGMVVDKAAYRARLAHAHKARVAVNRASCPPCVPLDQALRAEA